jgi:ATP-binding cassette subfamily B protein
MYLILLVLSSLQFIIENCYEEFFYKKSVDNVNNIEIEEKKITADYVNKIITYKSMGLEKNFKNNMDNLYNKLIIYKNKEALYYGISFLVSNTLNNSLQIILIYIGVYFNINYNLIYEFILYINEVNNIIRELTIVKRDFVKNKLPLKKIKELFNTTSDNIHWGNYKYNDINECIPSIKIKNLSFSYPNNKKIFQNFNLNINPFTVIGISGNSGIGKSTFFKLLLRLYNEYTGSILIDNIPIENFDRNYYYDNIITYVGQESELLEGTINENILGYNLKNYDIKLYNIVLELITDINNLYETYDKLSGGQKQRIAICRAIMKKPKIILLDEPSSALNINNEKKLLLLLKKISYEYNITIIIISHKKYTLNICDYIIDFNNININN